MKELMEMRRTEWGENYSPLTGDLRRIVQVTIGELLDAKATREEIRTAIVLALAQNGATEELKRYAEGFCRGLFGDGSAYYASGSYSVEDPNADRHIHRGYSAGFAFMRLRGGLS